MKKFFIISLLALLGMTQAAAQEYEYVPFVREGVKWICSNYYTLQQSHFTLELKGDAVINGVTYKAMHKYSGEEIDPNNDTIPVYMREEGKVVYAIVPDGKTYEGCPIGFDHDAETQEKIAAGEEFVLYDFNDAEGFIGRWIDMPFQACTVIPDMTAVGGWLAKRYIAKIDDEFCAIEGIGYDGLKSWYTLGNRDHYVLDWVIENGDTIYQSERYKGVYPGRLSSDLMPMAREGVKWVNERVVIENGDTTRSYYTYEFSGTNSRGYPICYSYTGESLDPSQAQEVAIFQGDYDDASFSNYFCNNLPFNKVIEQGRDMITFPGVMIYQFAYTNSDIEMTNPVNYYITSQKEDFLSRANFVEVEPIWIEGLKCRRYAYYGDGDEPLCYVVEGIGFDSRDMGDLLTPFTRKPDPDADYQEYWGLSHVIKDGKIIYKGMCYNNSDNVPGLPGDVNGDMVTNINDVVEIIEFLLESFNATIPSYDVNLDGLVNIADVTSLIGMLLANDESSINLRDKSNNPTRDESINDKPYVIYKNDTHSIIIYGTKAVDYYDVDIASVTTGASMISTWVDGSYGTIDVSTLPVGEYRITVNSPAWGNFEGNFEVY